ncbi:MAG TPA: hypothetical protein VLV55_01670 [Rhizomicrobium sp.]|nr:hypothetical protein [Rhizomicrobium sp.]
MGMTVDTPNGPFTLARSCDGCTLCCKVMRVDAPIDKPMNEWCRHCVPAQGCSIHETRPQVCRSFHCLWLIDGTLDENWQPERCHMVLWLDLEGRRLNANVDEDHPDAWRKEPNYTQLKNIAAWGMPQGGQVVVHVGQETFVILPDRHVALGRIAADEYIFFENLGEGRWDARKVSEIEAATLRAEGRAP